MSEEDLVLVRSRQTRWGHVRSAGPWERQGAVTVGTQKAVMRQTLTGQVVTVA